MDVSSTVALQDMVDDSHIGLDSVGLPSLFLFVNNLTRSTDTSQ